ncbi:MAG: dihydrolipoyl dehydrogenase [Saccharofermentanales bacterium]|jgi:dihydrolipoamide dehydrogenase|nr:dihydrolipoyl dehydrogenase [Bacillota bacterium]
MMTETMIYDLLIIGGGPGGYAAAERAGEARLTVALFEQNKLGGVCLNEGCIPSKTLLNSAKLYYQARNSQAFGIKTAATSYDQAQVIKRKNKVVRMLVAGVKQKMKAAGVEIIEAAARISGRDGDLFCLQDACGKKYLGRNLIIATGSVPIIPPVPGLNEALESGFAVTSRGILDLTEIPPHLVVIGAGVIGLEMASYYRTVGSEVTVIELRNQIAGEADPQLSGLLLKDLEQKGIRFLLGAKVTNIGADCVNYEQDGLSQELAADCVLCAAGRRPAISGLGLETLGIELQNGAVRTDAQGRTNVPGVYAVGDVNGSWMLAHAAYREAEVAVSTILGREDEVSYLNCPSVIYTSPEVAWVGLTEAEMEQAGKPYRKVELPFSYSGRYQAETEREASLCKLILDEESMTLAGCQLMGPYASEFIVAVGIMIKQKLTLDKIKAQIFPHPTVAEVIKEAIFML